jgi:hypothetical protein
LVTAAVKATLVPEHIPPVGELDTVTPAEPAVGDVGVNVPKLELVVKPFAVPVIEDGTILPATALLVVGCTCKPAMVTLSILLLLLPFIIIVSDVEVNVPCVTDDTFLAAVNPSVGFTAVLNCQPAGAASTTVTDQEPVLPISVLITSLMDMVPRVVQLGAPPDAA